MQIFRDIQAVNCSQPTVLTIGNFDGVHRGHQALLETLTHTADARSPKANTALVTFEPHPLKVLRPDLSLHLLTTPQERMQIAATLGIDTGLILPFTPELAALEAYEFLSLLKTQLAMTALVVGPDFALGRNRSGTLETLAELGNDLDYQLIVQEHIAWGDHSVRSRTIRQLLAGGDVGEAATLLGRPYHMAGVVEYGDQRGQQIGIPTANLAIPEDKLWPADGVYATRAWVMGGDTAQSDTAQSYPSVTNIGYRPTVNGRTHRLETHLLDFPAEGQSDNLYEQPLVVEFVDRLRGEQRFSGLDELVAQINADISHSRQLFTSIHFENKPFFTVSLL